MLQRTSSHFPRSRMQFHLSSSLFSVCQLYPKCMAKYWPLEKTSLQAEVMFLDSLACWNFFSAEMRRLMVNTYKWLGLNRKLTDGADPGHWRNIRLALWTLIIWHVMIFEAILLTDLKLGLECLVILQLQG